MTEIEAMRQAIDLIKVPSRVRQARRQSLPGGMALLLRIASGESLEDPAVLTTGQSPELLREAAVFYIEQILLAPDSDSYRVLGCLPDATQADLRRNMALLLRCLHPDKDASERALFATRVTEAWERLKTRDRRVAYDHQQALQVADLTDDKRRAQKRTRRRAAALLTAPAQHIGSLSPWRRILRRIRR